MTIFARTCQHFFYLILRDAVVVDMWQACFRGKVVADIPEMVISRMTPVKTMAKNGHVCVYVGAES